MVEEVIRGGGVLRDKAEGVFTLMSAVPGHQMTQDLRRRGWVLQQVGSQFGRVGAAG